MWNKHCSFTLQPMEQMGIKISLDIYRLPGNLAPYYFQTIDSFLLMKHILDLGTLVCLNNLFVYNKIAFYFLDMFILKSLIVYKGTSHD